MTDEFPKGQAHFRSLWWNIAVWWIDIIRNLLLKLGRDCDQNLILIAEISIWFLYLRSSKIRAEDFLNLIRFGTWISQGDGRVLVLEQTMYSPQIQNQEEHFFVIFYYL